MSLIRRVLINIARNDADDEEAAIAAQMLNRKLHIALHLALHLSLSRSLSLILLHQIDPSGAIRSKQHITFHFLRM